jgi:exonuclease SbcC
MLKSISLNNWRSHGESTVHFTEGTNLIIGRMGGGKSSIIDGICFALFGTCPAIQHRRIKVTDLIRSRPNEEQEAKISLTFDHRNDEYTVVRSIKRNGNGEAEIRKNGERMEGPQPVRVTEYLTNLLEIDYDLFTRAIYSEQNRIDHFLNVGRGERKKQIDELIGIDKFEEARKNATTLAGRLKGMYADKQLLLRSFDEEAMRSEIGQMREKITSNEGILSKTEKEFDYIERERLKLETTALTMGKKREHYRLLNEKRTGLKHTLSSLKTELSQMAFNEQAGEEAKKKLDNVRNEKTKTQTETSAIEHAYEKISNEYAKSIAEERTLQDQLKKRSEFEQKRKELLQTDTLEGLSEKLSKIEAEIDSLSEDIHKNKAQAAELNKAIAELNKDIAKCPICDSELNEEKKSDILKQKNENLKKATEVVDSYGRAIETNTRLLKQLKERYEKTNLLQQMLADLEGLEGRISDVRKTKELNEARSEEIKRQKELLLKKSEDISADYLEISKQIEKINNFLNKKRTAEQIEKELHGIDSQLKELSFNETEWDSATNELRKLSVNAKEIEGQLVSVKQTISHLKTIAGERANRLEEMKRYREDMQAYNQEAEKLQIFANAIVETQQSLRTELMDAVNQALDQIWTMIYPYSDYTSLKLSPSDSDYDLLFKVEDEWVSVDGIASGGERALACLALRVSFAMVLTPNLSWLILDEPTHNLDEEAVRTLAVTLHDHIPRIVEQTFVITHEENLKDAANGKVFKVFRNAQHPEISTVEELMEKAAATPSLS